MVETVQRKRWTVSVDGSGGWAWSVGLDAGLVALHHRYAHLYLEQRKASWLVSHVHIWLWTCGAGCMAGQNDRRSVHH
jgi:hypothetical protein